MFKLNFSFILFLMSFVFMSGGCRRHDCSKDKPIQILLPQEVLDYVDFKAGTYWIYQDIATGRIDSEVVLSSKHTMENVSATNLCGDIAITSQYENIEMIIQRYDSLGNKKESWLREFDNSFKKYHHNQDSIFVIDNSNYFTIGYPFTMNFYDGSYDITEYMFDSIIVFGTNYKNVLTVKHTFNSPPPITEDYAFFVRKIGIISFRTYNSGKDNQIRNLIRYKIL